MWRADVPPATHATGAAPGGADSPPSDAHMRLRADFDLARLPSDAARSETQTTTKWATLGFDARSLDAIKAADFEVLDAGPAQAWDGDSVRAP
jgi:hypothetical protein